MSQRLELVCMVCAMLAVAVLVAATLAWGHAERSYIGANEIPAGLRCNEDELIGYLPPANGEYGTLTLGCLHYGDILAEAY